MDDAADTLLTQADACHDDVPEAAAATLRRLALAQLPAARWPRAAFLFNHVLGELLGDWREAQQRTDALASLAGAQAPNALWRQAAVAARLAGDAAAQARHAQALAAASGAPLPQVNEPIALAAVSFTLEGRDVAAAARDALDVLTPLHNATWQRPGPLDADVAAMCNNIASHFVDRPLAELSHPALRETLAEAARLSAAFWQRAGGWVQHERACHLRALASHALHAPGEALVHAQRGLALIAAHDREGAETVDRAFLTLELALAHRRLGRADEAAQMQANAEALMREVGDDALQRWFDERVARNSALATVPAWN
jgi:hypothetical protein